MSLFSTLVFHGAVCSKDLCPYCKHFLCWLSFGFFQGLTFTPDGRLMIVVAEPNQLLVYCAWAVPYVVPLFWDLGQENRQTLLWVYYFSIRYQHQHERSSLETLRSTFSRFGFLGVQIYPWGKAVSVGAITCCRVLCFQEFQIILLHNHLLATGDTTGQYVRNLDGTSVSSVL